MSFWLIATAVFLAAVLVLGLALWGCVQLLSL
jgi:hypothetical protein